MNEIFWIRFFDSDSDNLKSKIQKRPRGLKSVGLVTYIIAFVICGVAVEAQQPTKIPRIGYLGAVSLSASSARIEAFRQGLRELGYVDGKNIVVEYRWAEGKIERLPDLATELVRLTVDVIVTSSAAPTRAAVPTAPAWLQRAGLGADVIGTGATQRGSEGGGCSNVDYAPVPAAPAGLRCAGLGA